MDERFLTRLREAGFTGEVAGSLTHESAAFALSETALAFVDAAGARQVALRDINRIHSDKDGVLRVETVGGTAITASLLGFDPSGVQNFFNEVRIATNTAKQLPQPPHAVPITQGPWKSGWSSGNPSAAPAETVQAPTGGVATSAQTAPLPFAAPKTEAPVQATPARSPAVTPEPAPSSPAPEVEERVTVLPRPSEAGTSATTLPTPAPTPPSRPPAKPVVISTAPRYNPPAETPRPEPAKPAQDGSRKPPQATKAPQQPQTSKPAAVKQEAPRQDAPNQSTPKPEARPPVPSPARAPSREVAATRPAGSLLALADSVERLSGTLRLLAVAMGLAAILIGILRFRDGDSITGLWILGSGVVAAFALLVFAQVARLLVGMARQLNPDA